MHVFIADCILIWECVNFGLFLNQNNMQKLETNATINKKNINKLTDYCQK